MRFSFAAVVALLLAASAAGAQAPAAKSPKSLSNRVDRGDTAAFVIVLDMAERTLPGANLEDLAEISSHFVRANPEAFLRVQSRRTGCFGVSFMGYDFVDQPEKRTRERLSRIAALESVALPELEKAKQKCLGELRK